jgi:hypothetical protein
MSTPITQLPKGSTAAPPLPEDPDAQLVLKELESEVERARGEVSMPPPKPQMMQHPPAYVTTTIKQAPGYAGLWNQQYAQYALLAAVLAVIFFYYGTNALDGIYSRIPKVGDFLANHDTFVRAAMFALVIYVLLVKLKI